MVGKEARFSEMVQRSVDNQTRGLWLKLKCSRVQPGMKWAKTELRVWSQWPKQLPRWPGWSSCQLPFTSADIPDWTITKLTFLLLKNPSRTKLQLEMETERCFVGAHKSQVTSQEQTALSRKFNALFFLRLRKKFHTSFFFQYIQNQITYKIKFNSTYNLNSINNPL